MFAKFPFTKQLDAMDCGPACLKMVAEFYGKNYPIQKLRKDAFITREGVSLLGISDAAENIGFRTLGVRIDFEKLIHENPLPCIVHWQQKHFVVVYRIEKKKDGFVVYVSDPAHGRIKYTKTEFLKAWISTSNDSLNQGVALILEPTPDFYNQKDERVNKKSLTFLFKYLNPYKGLLFQLFLGLLVGSLLQLIFPFLTQSIVDIGIKNQDIGFITIILIGQLFLFISQTSVNIVRSWILLHISTRINISLISDFLIKLMKLPIGFFDSKMIGDLLQRINDHQRIENFLTASTLQILFSIINLIVFAIVLGIYSLKILIVFIIGSLIYILWVLVFMKRRREIDFKRFDQLADNQSNLIQLITGMQEIKLNNCEKQKRWDWERIQAKLFKTNIKSLALDQYQQSGGAFFNQLKNILITFIAAESVVNMNMTLGMMLAVQYIIGQLNAPIEQLIGFIRSAQDAKISLERLGEVHLMDNEKKEGTVYDTLSFNKNEKNDIDIKNLSFHYEGPRSPQVLKNMSLQIPEKKVTAIVGTSGSGKTTLVKLLLGFYSNYSGKIVVGPHNIKTMDKSFWRKSVGAVMQDGFIFSDTIANNIVLDNENINQSLLDQAISISNLDDIISNLPLGINTKIGQEGSGLSQGQKQRILIARAVYKNPQYLFFDEATNALDANNELQIMNKLNNYFKGKTVITVAHRLSTVKNADQIIVIEKGEIKETGTHDELSKLKGVYYNLVKNQLELGK
jgi:ATP-binding cassette subfamily B protein